MVALGLVALALQCGKVGAQVDVVIVVAVGGEAEAVGCGFLQVGTHVRAYAHHAEGLSLGFGILLQVVQDRPQVAVAHGHHVAHMSVDSEFN